MAHAHMRKERRNNVIWQRFSAVVATGELDEHVERALSGIQTPSTHNRVGILNEMREQCIRLFFLSLRMSER